MYLVLFRSVRGVRTFQEVVDHPGILELAHHFKSIDYKSFVLNLPDGYPGSELGYDFAP